MSEKERPYYLHGIMIHDGLAENGHYYTYLYDRNQKIWWKLDDHRISMESEDVVMKEALGGDGYKSACNIFYMSKHIADQISNYKKPLYTAEHANSFEINPEIIRQIQQENYQFEVKNQAFVIQ
jgi:ubiquitin carboxyl-terminal hydrolase 25/28